MTSQIPLFGSAELGLARTVEEYDGPTIWLMGRRSTSEPWTILSRTNEGELFYAEPPQGDPLWAIPVGNVLGYDGLLVRHGESALVLTLINGEPRIALQFWNLEGFADLDLDGELEVVCRRPESGYEIYDREPDGHYRYCYCVNKLYRLLESIEKTGGTAQC